MAVPFQDIKYSDVAQQGRGEKDTYARKYGYAGWQEMEAAGGASLAYGGGSSGISTTTPDYEAIYKRSLELQQQAIQPAITSYQAQIPETQARFATETQRLQAEQEPLEKRYQNLLAEVTGRQQQEEQRTGIATAQELGRRGISAESGLYSQEINKALSPITQFYTGQAKELGLSQEDAMRNLQNLIAGIPQQEIESLRQIQNAIAALQGGAGQSAVSSALNLYQTQQQAAQQAAQLALQQQIAQAEEAYKQSQLTYQQQQAAAEQARYAQEWPYQQRMYEYELGKPYYKPETGGGVIDFNALYNQFNAASQPNTFQNWFSQTFPGLG